MTTTSSARRGTAMALGAFAGLTGLYLRVCRPRLLYWGSTADERQRSLPGDDVIANPVAMVTHAITIDAPVPAVWPWIAQLGSQDLGRAGWYSYDRFDNAGVPSATTLLDCITAPHVGDVLVSDPAFAWTVQAIEPASALFEPIDFLMMRRHHLNLKQRAEGAVSQPSPARPGRSSALRMSETASVRW